MSFLGTPRTGVVFLLDRLRSWAPEIEADFKAHDILNEAELQMRIYQLLRNLVDQSQDPRWQIRNLPWFPNERYRPDLVVTFDGEPVLPIELKCTELSPFPLKKVEYDFRKLSRLTEAYPTIRGAALLVLSGDRRKRADAFARESLLKHAFRCPVEAVFITTGDWSPADVRRWRDRLPATTFLGPLGRLRETADGR